MIHGEFINQIAGASVKPPNFAVISCRDNDIGFRPDDAFDGAVMDVWAKFNRGCWLMEVENAELLFRATSHHVLGIRIKVNGADNMVVGKSFEIFPRECVPDFACKVRRSGSSQSCVVGQSCLPDGTLVADKGTYPIKTLTSC